MQNNPNNKKNIIKTIIVSFIALALAVGTITGGVIYLKHNKEKLEFDFITFPWEKKDFMWPWEQGNYTEEEKIAKEIEEQTVTISGLKKPDFSEPIENETTYGILRLDSINLDKKGFELDMSYNNSRKYWYHEPVSIEIKKLLVDDLDFQIDKVTIEKSSNKIIKISRPKFELYNKNGFKKLTFYYKETNDVGETNEGFFDITVLNRTTPTTKLGRRINIDTKNTADGTISIYYWKKLTDDSNTYLYFYAENKGGSKDITIKKLLINDKLYDYSDLNEEIYTNSSLGFALTIPKKDVKNIKKIDISFFVKTKPKDNYGEGIYIMNEYSATIKD